MRGAIVSRMARHIAAMAAMAAIAIAPRLARADTKAVAYSYEVENLDAYPDKVFVAWPRTCGSTGDPLGAVSLQLNPDWVSRLHEVDYEVLGKGRRHEISPYCAQTTRIYALPATSFPRADRLATADDSSLGKKPGETLSILPALDEIDLPKRLAFFASDPRRAASPFRFDVVAVAPARSPLKAVHDVLAVEGAFGGGGATFAIAGKRAVYTYEDGAPEVVPYGGGQRPAPGRAGALGADAGASASASAGASADAGARADAGAGAAVVPSSPGSDLGSRWVYAAAIVGLVAGGIIAYYQKKRAASPR